MTKGISLSDAMERLKLLLKGATVVFCDHRNDVKAFDVSWSRLSFCRYFDCEMFDITDVFSNTRGLCGLGPICRYYANLFGNVIIDHDPRADTFWTLRVYFEVILTGKHVECDTDDIISGVQYRNTIKHE